MSGGSVNSAEPGQHSVPNQAVKLFLSAAEEDGEIAQFVADRLEALGYTVHYWQRERGGRFIERIEEAIEQSEAFIALLSPDFLTSTWCRREAALAIQREEDMRIADPQATFLHVVEVRDTPDRRAGFLRIYDRVTMAGLPDRGTAIDDLSRRLRLGISAQPVDSPAARPARSAESRAVVSDDRFPEFRNRHDELERVLNGLAGAGGPHFWLVIAPPQLGKTWFLKKLRSELASSGPHAWDLGNVVDVRELPQEERTDVAALLGRLFGRTWPVTTEPDSLRRIAQEICGRNKSWLCLLDRAELLDVDTAIELRSCFSQIYERVRRFGPTGVRACLVVSGRREDKWRSVTPRPRVSTLVLTEFSVEVVEEALRDLADKMGRTFDAETFTLNAALVHRLGEGLPAMLTRCLQWIRDEEWMELERLETQQLFEELAQPYIKAGLLSRESLFSWNGGRRPHPGGSRGYPRLALEHAFRVLAPYRIFTQSQLRHYHDNDPSFAAALRQSDWLIEDVWRAISGTALLKRPLDEPWQELHAAIRRLLYRYYFTSDPRRAEAHREAGEFVRVWADKQSGKEQVIGLVEALWHEAVMLRLSQPDDMEQSLIESARKLSQMLGDSSAYSVEELRTYAAERMRNDEELQDAVSNVEGLFNKLVTTVESASES
jgi:hypothetical protein